MTKSATEICKLVYALDDEDAEYMANDLAMEIICTDVNFYRRFPSYKATMSVSDAMKILMDRDSEVKV